MRLFCRWVLMKLVSWDCVVEIEEGRHTVGREVSDVSGGGGGGRRFVDVDGGGGRRSGGGLGSFLKGILPK